MPEIGMSVSMSGDGKRSVGHRPQATAPILDSTDNVFAEYDRVKLTDIVAPKDAALKSVVVHNYTILDTKTAEPKPGPGKRTAEKIEQNKHTIVPGTADAVDAHLIDDTGKYRPEWTKLLRH